jgi:hypothetical protein
MARAPQTRPTTNPKTQPAPSPTTYFPQLTPRSNRLLPRLECYGTSRKESAVVLANRLQVGTFSARHSTYVLSTDPRLSQPTSKNSLRHTHRKAATRNSLKTIIALSFPWGHVGNFTSLRNSRSARKFLIVAVQLEFPVSPSKHSPAALLIVTNGTKFSPSEHAFRNFPAPSR